MIAEVSAVAEAEAEAEVEAVAEAEAEAEVEVEVEVERGKREKTTGGAFLNETERAGANPQSSLPSEAFKQRTFPELARRP